MNNTIMKKVLFVKREEGRMTVYSMNAHSEKGPKAYKNHWGRKASFIFWCVHEIIAMKTGISKGLGDSQVPI